MATTKSLPSLKATAKRLPHPATHGYRGDRLMDDPLDNPAPMGGMEAAEAWARWKADQLGIEIPKAYNGGVPEFHIEPTTCAEDEHDAVFYHATRTYSRKLQPGEYCKDGYNYRNEDVARFRIPAHAVHYARCDLWHLARQGGATLEEAAHVANGYRWALTDDIKAASVPVKATSKGAAGKQESFLALLDTPTRFVQAIRDDAEKRRLERIEQEARNAAASLKWFEEGRAKALDNEGEDGTLAFQGYGDDSAIGWVAEDRRKDWMKAARECREYGLDAERVAFCVARARMFSRYAREAFVIERAARAVYLAVYLAEQEAKRAAEAARDFVAEAKAGVVCNTGQVTPEGKRQLERAVKRGELVKWRGYWYPQSGAPRGLGPLKTCYGATNPYADTERVAA